MSFSQELVHELNALNLFDLDSGQQGIKVHKTAQSDVIEAVRRLHAKGLVSQVDGGYLTPLGLHAANAAQALHGLLTSGLAAKVQ